MYKTFPYLVCFVFLMLPFLVFAPHASIVFLILMLLCFNGHNALLIEKLQSTPRLFFRETALFLVYFLITGLWSIKPSATFHVWIRTFSLWIIGILLVNVCAMTATKKQKEYLCLALTLGFVTSLFCILMMISNEGLFYNHIRSLFTFGTAQPYNIEKLNKIAVILSFLLWPILGFLQNYAGNKAIIFIVIAMVAVIFQLESLAASLGIILGIITYASLLWKEKTFFLFHRITVFSSFVGFFLLIYFTDPVQLIHSFSFPASAEHRLYIWKFALNTALESPWIGWGMDMSRYIPYGLLDKVPVYNSPLPLHPHNSLLQAFLEGGIFALSLHLAFIAMLYTLIRKSNHVAEYMGLFTSGLVVAMTSYSLWQFWWVASLFIAIACFNFIPKEEENDDLSSLSK